MIFGAQGSQQFRTRMGWMVLACGVGLVLWAWGWWIYRASRPDDADRTIPELQQETPLGRLDEGSGADDEARLAEGAISAEGSQWI